MGHGKGSKQTEQTEKKDRKLKWNLNFEGMIRYERYEYGWKLSNSTK